MCFLRDEILFYLYTPQNDHYNVLSKSGTKLLCCGCAFMYVFVLNKSSSEIMTSFIISWFRYGCEDNSTVAHGSTVGPTHEIDDPFLPLDSV